MPKTSSIEKPFTRNLEFPGIIRREGITNLDRCYQCYACSNACPLAYAMDYYPNQLIHMVRLGLRDRVLQSKTIWLCVSCLTCVARCPNKIDIVRFMDILRQESLKEDLPSPMEVVPQFHRVFIREVQKRGRIFELGFLMRYKLKTGGLLSLQKIYEDSGFALKMFFKGKLKLRPQKFDRQKEVEDICQKILSKS